MANTNNRIEGKCHCGNIRFLFERSQQQPQIAVRACSCTFCQMHGGVYTSDPGGKLDVYVLDSSLVNKYRFGTKTAEFYICSRCGVVPVVSSEIEGNLYAVVNVNTFQNVDKSDLEQSITNFKGETTANRLGRRSKTWIPRVTINYA